jgi:hypothetical protein
VIIDQLFCQWHAHLYPKDTGHDEGMGETMARWGWGGEGGGREKKGGQHGKHTNYTLRLDSTPAFQHTEAHL